MNKRLKKILSISIPTILLLCSIKIPASASQISFSISPSKIYDKQIDIGSSESFSFNVSNDSVSDDNSNVPLEVGISGEVYDQYGNLMQNQDVLSFDKTDDMIDSGKTDSINVKIQVPSNAIQGSYTAYIVFTQENYSTTIGNVGIQKNSIKVPIYIFAGSKDEYSSKKVDYDITDNAVTIEGSEPETISNEVKNNLQKIINPLKIPSVLTDINNKPYYNFKENGKQIIDINNDIYTSLKNVATVSDKISDIKYVHYDKSWLSEKIKSSKIGTSSIEITLDDGSVIHINGTGNSIQYIQNQISNIAKSNNGDVDLNYLFDNLQVPKNINYEQAVPCLTTSIDSSSDIPITLQGDIALMLNNTDTISSKPISSPTINTNEAIKMNTQLSESNLSEGLYNITGSLKAKDVSKDINYSFEIKNKRTMILSVIGFVSILYLFIILILILIIVKIIKKIFFKKYLTKH